MQAIIIEDEPLVARDLQKLISQIDSAINIVAVIDSLKSAIEYFKSNPEPDLLFMDIQLSDGVSFDLFKQVEIKCPVIFTTAYNEYAIRAFKVNSIDYLLKPIDKVELTTAIEKFKKLKENPTVDIKEQLQSLMQHIALPNKTEIYKERFSAHLGKSFIIIDATNIVCFQKDALIYIITKDKQQFITDFQTMEEVEELLNPKYFFRANRQFIINANAVESYRTDSYSKLIVKIKPPVNITVDISREKAQAFKSWLG
ncbi:MAG: LytTR family DNA-binding domain-containing protein [Bacteroidia bacterium]